MEFVVDDWMQMYIDLPMRDWLQGLKAQDDNIPQIFLSFCGVFSTTLTLLVDDDGTVDLLADAFIELLKK